MRSDPSATPALVVVVGETASGKSALAMELARRFGGELICADSWTVYKGFDIGTAKPSMAEQQEIRHHLLDVADPEQGFSAVEFQRLATGAITDIQQRGRLPIMVGGTGLYIDSVLYDYQFLPAPPAGRRQELNERTLNALWRLAHEQGLDTTGIDMHNKRRVIRLIENNGRRPTRSSFRKNTLVMGIGVDRDHLRERITRRVDAMLTAGLELEVRRLVLRYGWEAEPMKGIGYREWYPYLNPEPGGQQDLAQTRERIIAATMGLAKRQRTWFKRNDRIHWLRSSNKMAEAVELLTTFISN